jgi:glycine cleavage system aminomethyltransferase T
MASAAIDLTRCAAGQGKYAPVIAPDGGIVNDPVLLRRGENTFWLCLADSDAHLYAMGLAQGGGLNVSVSLPEAYPLQIQGPKAKDLMRELAGEAMLPAALSSCGLVAVIWRPSSLVSRSACGDRSQPLPK